MKRFSLTLQRLFSRIPTSLPLGMNEFEAWTDSIVRLLPKGLEQVPRSDIQFVLSTAIQRLGATERLVSKHYFVCLLHKAAASQLAGAIFSNIKDEQKRKEAEAAAQKQAEATAPTETLTPSAPTETPA